MLRASLSNHTRRNGNRKMDRVLDSLSEVPPVQYDPMFELKKLGENTKTAKVHYGDGSKREAHVHCFSSEYGAEGIIRVVEQFVTCMENLGAGQEDWWLNWIHCLDATAFSKWKSVGFFRFFRI